MLNKEDFKKPIDWIIYNVNGSKENKTDNQIREDYKLSEAKYPLKFYKTRSDGRYSVHYGGKYVCNCSYDNARKVQDFFDEYYDGKNIEQISYDLKKEHNQIIKTSRRGRGRKPKTYRKNTLRFQPRENGRIKVTISDKGKTHTVCNCYRDQIRQVQKDFNELKTKYSLADVKKVMKAKYNIIGKTIEKEKPKKRGKKGRSYSENNVLFELRETGRVQVRVNDMGRTHTICSCSPNQKKHVSSRYDELKTNHDLDYIKKTMKNEFNLRVNGKINSKMSEKSIKHEISISEDGTIYKDGKYVNVDKHLYAFIDKLIQ